MQSSVGKEGLELLAFGDVSHIRHVASYRGPATLVRDNCFHIAPGMIRPFHAEMDRHRFRRGLQLRSQPVSDSVTLVGMDEVSGASTDELTRLESQELGDGGTH